MGNYMTIPYRFGHQVKQEKQEQKTTKEFKPELQTKQDFSDNTELDDLRVVYSSLAGKDADKRWKEDRLKEEIAKLS